jgi:hypothetical protein
LIGTYFLIVVALTLRVMGTAIRVEPFYPPIRAAGWLLCTAGTWIVLSAVGAWTSVWPALVVAIIGTLVDTRPDRRFALWIGADILVVLLSGLLAIPPLSFGVLLGMAVLITGIGFGIDWLFAQLPRYVRVAAVVGPLPVFLLFNILMPTTVDGGKRLLETRLLSVAFTLPIQSNQSMDIAGSTTTVHATEGMELVPSATAGASPASTAATHLPLILADQPASEPDPNPEPEPDPNPEPEPDPSPEPDPELEPDPPGPLDQVGQQWTSYLEWSLANPSYTGNPFDLIATATFVHAESGETRTTGMFFDGDDTWKFRFTGTRTGVWTFTTNSDDPELHGKSGTVTIEPSTNPNLTGFISNAGDKWLATATNRAFVPQFVMYSRAESFYNRPDKIDADIQTFLVEHGFTGFHSPVQCRWFDINQESCNDVNIVDPNPDRRTFAALELLITRTYAAGGTVHLWAWGDESRGQTPKRWGINGTQDQRLQRYIAARLGPLPGWTMGYGYDLWEWVTEEELTAWHTYMHEHMGWPHMLGARAQKNEINQLSEAMDYASYEQVRPDYDLYVAAIDARPSKPAFSEDRFRILEDTSSDRHFTADQTRRLLWQSTMAGGIANIFGNLTNGGSHADGSAPYPNADQIKTYATFFAERFTADLQRCNTLTDGVCLQRPTNAHYIFYAEDRETITLNLTAMAGPQPAVAVDTTRPYQEIDLGQLDATQHIWTAPYSSDWAIVVGNF